MKICRYYMQVILDFALLSNSVAFIKPISLYRLFVEKTLYAFPFAFTHSCTLSVRWFGPTHPNSVVQSIAVIT